MNKDVLKAITNQLDGFVAEHQFIANDAGDEYSNDKLAFRIVHDEEKKFLNLLVAQKDEEGNLGDFKVVSSWLFEESENTRDAASAGLDFLDTLKGKMGIRGVRTSRTGEVTIPKKDISNTNNMESFCAKTLAVFPQYKDEYKEHVSKYGSLLYVEFFKNTFMLKMGDLLDENNKKTLKKVFDLLSNSYCNGDRPVQNVIVGVILGGATKDNLKRHETTLKYLEDYSFLKGAYIQIYEIIKKDKKFLEILG